MIKIKINFYFGFSCFIFNQILSPTIIVISDYSVFMQGYGIKILSGDSYFGMLIDIVIHLLFSINLHNIAECLKIYGVL